MTCNIEMNPVTPESVFNTFVPPSYHPYMLNVLETMLAHIENTNSLDIFHRHLNMATDEFENRKGTAPLGGVTYVGIFHEFDESAPLERAPQVAFGLFELLFGTIDHYENGLVYFSDAAYQKMKGIVANLIAHHKA